MASNPALGELIRELTITSHSQHTGRVVYPPIELAPALLPFACLPHCVHTLTLSQLFLPPVPYVFDALALLPSLFYLRLDNADFKGPGLLTNASAALRTQEYTYLLQHDARPHGCNAAFPALKRLSVKHFRCADADRFVAVGGLLRLKHVLSIKVLNLDFGSEVQCIP